VHTFCEATPARCGIQMPPLGKPVCAQ
jgi:hypothetical protein